MVDMNALERQLADESLRIVGPVRPVDDAALFTAITTTQSPKWRFQSMFNATKYVVAGAIVALFGGFLLAGVLTTQPSDEAAPAAVSASPSTSPDPLPSVDLEVEEVSPGVFRVLGDGERDLRENVWHVAISPEGNVLVERFDLEQARPWIHEIGGPRVGSFDEVLPDYWGDGSDLLECEFAPDGACWSGRRNGDHAHDVVRTDPSGEVLFSAIDDIGFEPPGTRATDDLILTGGDIVALEFELAQPWLGRGLEGADWALAFIDGEELADPAAGEASLRLVNGEASGSTGCRSFSGTYELDGESLTFGEHFAVTQAFCDGPVGEEDQAYLDALGTIEAWSFDPDTASVGDIEIDADGTVWVSGSNGTTLGLASFDGESWTVIADVPGPHMGADGSVGPHLEIGPDGAVWLKRVVHDTFEVGLSRWDGAEWSSFGPVASGNLAHPFEVASDGTIWVGPLTRFDGTSFHRIDTPRSERNGQPRLWSAAHAPDGSIWAVVGDQTQPMDALCDDSAWNDGGFDRPCGGTTDGLHVITPEAVAGSE
jgi:heat shock protein HslJ